MNVMQAGRKGSGKSEQAAGDSYCSGMGEHKGKGKRGSNERSRKKNLITTKAVSMEKVFWGQETKIVRKNPEWNRGEEETVALNRSFVESPEKQEGGTVEIRIYRRAYCECIRERDITKNCSGSVGIQRRNKGVDS